jgi:hypothetical protein
VYAPGQDDATGQWPVPTGARPQGLGTAGQAAGDAKRPGGRPHGEGASGFDSPSHQPDVPAAACPDTIERTARQVGWLLGSGAGVVLRESARTARSAGRLLDAWAERAVGR